MGKIHARDEILVAASVALQEHDYKGNTTLAIEDVLPFLSDAAHLYWSRMTKPIRARLVKVINRG